MPRQDFAYAYSFSLDETLSFQTLSIDFETDSVNFISRNNEVLTSQNTQIIVVPKTCTFPVFFH